MRDCVYIIRSYRSVSRRGVFNAVRKSSSKLEKLKPDIICSRFDSVLRGSEQIFESRPVPAGFARSVYGLKEGSVRSRKIEVRERDD